jgi:hypothetical protein
MRRRFFLAFTVITPAFAWASARPKPNKKRSPLVADFINTIGH